VLVIAPVCLGPDQKPVNVNADTVAYAIATSIAAQALEFVSDVAGVRTAQTSCADRLSVAEVKQLLQGSEVNGGMIPKLQAALAALDAGVGQVRIGNIQSMKDKSATKIVTAQKD
jgi:acetylglutamate kinase